jgi:hypothetical protein
VGTKARESDLFVPAYLQGILALAVRLVDADRSAGTRCYLPRCLINGNSLKVSFIIVINGLDDRIGSSKDNESVPTGVGLGADL